MLQRGRHQRFQQRLRGEHAQVLGWGGQLEHIVLRAIWRERKERVASSEIESRLARLRCSFRLVKLNAVPLAPAVELGVAFPAQVVVLVRNGWITTEQLRKQLPLPRELRFAPCTSLTHRVEMRRKLMARTAYG